MKSPAHKIVFHFMNNLHRHAFGVYLPLYSLYKRIGDRQKIDVLRHHIRPGMTILDIGANVGFYTRLFSRMTGENGSVHAFEPDPENFARLKSATRRCNNIVLSNAAVAAASGLVRLYHSDNLNVDHRCFDSGDGRHATEVKAVAVDDYFRSGETVDCVKIDVQGYEPFALKGMLATLARSPRVLLVSEVWPFGLHKAGSSVEKFFTLLRGIGFESRTFDPVSIRALSARQGTESFYTDLTATKDDQAR